MGKYTSVLLAILFVSTPTKLNAIILIRDAEIENHLQLIAKPIFQAAKLDDEKIEIFLIQTQDMNAFIISNNSVFFTTGLLLKLKTPEMFQAILAHEVAHITSGHILKTTINLNKGQKQTNLGLMFGAVIASTISPDAGLAISLSANIVAQNNFLKHSRDQEVIADSIGIKLLRIAKTNPANALKAMELFEFREKLTTLNENIYLRTHPLSTKRVQNLKTLIREQKPLKYTFDKELTFQYQRILAKLSAFSNQPDRTLRELRRSDNSEIALIKKVIALHRKPDPAKALSALKQLMAIKPDDPYILEILGQIYLETGQPEKAIDAFSKASNIIPSEPSFLTWMGISHLALDKYENDVRALKILKNANQTDPINPRLLRYLSIAYARNNQIGQAELKTAEYSVLSGHFNAARMHANKALAFLKPYSIEWRRAQDILSISSQIGVKD